MVYGIKKSYYSLMVYWFGIVTFLHTLHILQQFGKASNRSFKHQNTNGSSCLPIDTTVKRQLNRCCDYCYCCWMECIPSQFLDISENLLEYWVLQQVLRVYILIYMGKTTYSDNVLFHNSTYKNDQHVSFSAQYILQSSLSQFWESHHHIWLHACHSLKSSLPHVKAIFIETPLWSVSLIFWEYFISSHL